MREIVLILAAILLALWLLRPYRVGPLARSTAGLPASKTQGESQCA